MNAIALLGMAGFFAILAALIGYLAGREHASLSAYADGLEDGHDSAKALFVALRDTHVEGDRRYREGYREGRLDYQRFREREGLNDSEPLRYPVPYDTD